METWRMPQPLMADVSVYNLCPKTHFKCPLSDTRDNHCCQNGLSKEDLRDVPPRNCQHTVIPSEKKQVIEEAVGSVCLPSYLRFWCKGNYSLM